MWNDGLVVGSRGLTTLNHLKYVSARMTVYGTVEWMGAAAYLPDSRVKQAV